MPESKHNDKSVLQRLKEEIDKEKEILSKHLLEKKRAEDLEAQIIRTRHELNSANEVVDSKRRGKEALLSSRSSPSYSDFYPPPPSELSTEAAFPPYARDVSQFPQTQYSNDQVAAVERTRERVDHPPATRVQSAAIHHTQVPSVIPATAIPSMHHSSQPIGLPTERRVEYDQRRMREPQREIIYTDAPRFQEYHEPLISSRVYGNQYQRVESPAEVHSSRGRPVCPLVYQSSLEEYYEDSAPIVVTEQPPVRVLSQPVITQVIRPPVRASYDQPAITIKEYYDPPAVADPSITPRFERAAVGETWIEVNGVKRKVRKAYEIVHEPNGTTYERDIIPGSEGTKIDQTIRVPLEKREVIPEPSQYPQPEPIHVQSRIIPRPNMEPDSPTAGPSPPRVAPKPRVVGTQPQRPPAPVYVTAEQSENECDGDEEEEYEEFYDEECDQSLPSNSTPQPTQQRLSKPKPKRASNPITQSPSKLFTPTGRVSNSYNVNHNPKIQNLSAVYTAAHSKKRPASPNMKPAYKGPVSDPARGFTAITNNSAIQSALRAHQHTAPKSKPEWVKRARERQAAEAQDQQQSFGDDVSNGTWQITGVESF